MNIILYSSRYLCSAFVCSSIHFASRMADTSCTGRSSDTPRYLLRSSIHLEHAKISNNAQRQKGVHPVKGKATDEETFGRANANDVISPEVMESLSENGGPLAKRRRLRLPIMATSPTDAGNVAGQSASVSDEVSARYNSVSQSPSVL